MIVGYFQRKMWFCCSNTVEDVPYQVLRVFETGTKKHPLTLKNLIRASYFTFDLLDLLLHLTQSVSSSQKIIYSRKEVWKRVSLSMFCLIDLLKIFVALYLISFNPFVANAPFLCPRKYQKTLEGCRKGALGTNGSIEIIGSHWKKLQW